MEETKELPGKDDPAMAGMLAKEEPPKEPAEQENEPPADHPRFKDIYGKWKTAERSIEEHKTKLSETEKMLAELAEHNRKLAESISTVEKKIPEPARPDPAEDPVGYDQWMMDKIKREMAPKPEPYKVPESKKPVQEINQTLLAQEAAMAAVYDDYYQVAETIANKMKTDSVLRDEIMSSPNPAKALYNHHLRLKGKSDDDMNRGSVDTGGGYEPSKGKVELSPEQKQMANFLGVSEKQYAQQLAITRR